MSTTVTEYGTRRAAVENALNSVGTSGHLIAQHLRDTTAAAASFCGQVHARTVEQATHDLLTNIPCGILRDNEATPQRALLTALVSAIGSELSWDIPAALELCADILDDVNAHDEAAAVRAMAGAR